MPHPSALRILVTDRLLLTGLAVFTLGCGPLFIWIAFDPTANPVGPGMLAMLTFWPSIVLTLVGLARGSWRAIQCLRHPRS